MNDLQARKAQWSEADVNRFTTLVREDHASEQALVAAAEAANKADEVVDQAFDDLLRTILARYHEEQVWSDKIRRAGTIASAAVIAMNMLVFVAAVLVVEPWKRRRMVEAFEERVERMDASNRQALEAAVSMLDGKLESLGAPTTSAPLVTMPSAPANTQRPASSQDEVMVVVLGLATLGSIVHWLWRMQ
jgi:sensitive to high expression protein 9